MMEVALRLEAEHEEIALLALFDPDPEHEVPLRSRLAQHVRELRGLTLSEKTAFFRRKTAPLVERLKRVFVGAPATAIAYEALHRAKWANKEWLQRFPTALFLSQPRYAPEVARAEAVRAWTRRSRALTIVDLPGDRLSAFAEPNVRVAGERLTQCLELARTSRTTRFERP
jgi:thioesterase domain-containing protein